MRIKILIWFNLIVAFSYAQQSEEVFLKGVKQLDLGNYKVADSLITKAIIYDKAYNKLDYLKFYNRGLARRYMDSIPGAIDDFGISITINNTFFLSFYQRSVCHFMYDHDSLSLLDINKAIALMPADLDAYIVRIIVNMDLKNYKAMVSDCSKALMLEKDPRFYGLRSIANTFLNNLEYAKKDIDTGNRYFPTHTYILESEIFFLFKTKKNICAKFKELQQLDADFALIPDVDFLSAIEKCR